MCVIQRGSEAAAYRAVKKKNSKWKNWTDEFTSGENGRRHSSCECRGLLVGLLCWIDGRLAADGCRGLCF